jgi:hypothetical protein
MGTRRLLILAGLLLLAAAGSGAGGAPDRLDQLRRLAASRLSVLELGGPDPSSEKIFREIYEILDGEILESLNSGGLFLSEGFLQERLDALSEAWGGSVFRVLTFPRDAAAVGIFQLSPAGEGTSVRLYVKNRSRYELGQKIDRPGVPLVFAMSPSRGGQGQLLVAWVGSQFAGGLTALRVDLLSLVQGEIRTAWTTDAFSLHELSVTAFTVGGQEVAVRYDPRYPGWKPGCEPKTEQEDLYRYDSSRETFLLARRRVLNGWHREFHSQAVGRLLAALSAGDDRALEALVPNVALRTRLPKRLEAEPVCDIVIGRPPSEVIVSAVAPSDRVAWALSFRRFSQGWKLAGAFPIR